MGLLTRLLGQQERQSKEVHLTRRVCPMALAFQVLKGLIKPRPLGLLSGHVEEIGHLQKILSCVQTGGVGVLLEAA